jgi:hypothetical protein
MHRDFQRSFDAQSHPVASDTQHCNHNLPWTWFADFKWLCATENKKADTAEHSKVSGHVGLLVNEPPGRTELLFV